MAGCKICGKPVVGRGFCRAHYQSLWKQGRLSEHSLNHRPLRDRLMEKIAKQPNGCWLWTGHTNDYGYGLVWSIRRAIRAHRASYQEFKGPISSTDIVCHTCDNPPCINPDHLFIGTKLDNNRDAKQKGRNAFGDRNGRRKICYADVLEIRASTETQSILALQYSLHQSTISDIRSFKTWKQTPD